MIFSIFGTRPWVHDLMVCDLNQEDLKNKDVNINPNASFSLALVNRNIATLKLIRKIWFKQAMLSTGDNEIKDLEQKAANTIPVSTRRQYDVVTTLFGRQQRCYNVKKNVTCLL